MTAANLPDYPPKGQRKRLDQDWLETVHSQGISQFLSDAAGPPVKFLDAVEEFNQGQYWLCHETLEAVWLPERYPLRLFYHGLIKVAVGLLHLQRRNRHGALTKLSDASYTLSPFSPQFQGVDTAGLLGDVEQRLEHLGSSPDTDWAAIERLPVVQIKLL